MAGPLSKSEEMNVFSRQARDLSLRIADYPMAIVPWMNAHAGKHSSDAPTPSVDRNRAWHVEDAAVHRAG